VSRYGTNPLDRAPGWHQGVAPGGGPAPHHEPEPEREHFSGYTVGDADWMLQCRAVRLVRQRYGIQSPASWSRNADQYDRIAQQVYRNLMAGKDPWGRG